MTRPSVSVVLPVHNRIEFLEEAVDSVLDQTYRGKTEVIVVDDGSEAPVEAALGDRYPQITWVRTPNQGLGGARQIGSLHSATDLIAYQDDDDYWHPDKLSRQVDFLQSNPGVRAVCCDLAFFADAPGHGDPWFRNLDSYRRILDRTGGDGTADVFPAGSLIHPIYFDMPFFAQCILIRRDFFQEIRGWDSRVRLYSEVFDFFTRLTLQGPLGFLDEVLVEVRRGHAHMTRDYAESKWRETVNLARMGFRLQGRSAKSVLPHLARRLYRYGRHQMRRGTIARAALASAWGGALALKGATSRFA